MQNSTNHGDAACSQASYIVEVTRGNIRATYRVSHGSDAQTICNDLSNRLAKPGAKTSVTIRVSAGIPVCMLRAASDALHIVSRVATCAGADSATLSAESPGPGFSMLLTVSANQSGHEARASATLSLSVLDESTLLKSVDIGKVADIACIKVLRPAIHVTYVLGGEPLRVELETKCGSYEAPYRLELRDIPMSRIVTRGDSIEDVLAKMAKKIKALAKLMDIVDVAELYVEFLGALGRVIDPDEMRRKVTRGRVVVHVYAFGVKRAKQLYEYLRSNMDHVVSSIPRVIDLSKTWISDLRAVRAESFENVFDEYSTYGYLTTVFRRNSLRPVKLMVKEAINFRPATINEYGGHIIYVFERVTLKRLRDGSKLSLVLDMQSGETHRARITAPANIPIRAKNLDELFTETKAVYTLLALLIKAKVMDPRTRKKLINEFSERLGLPRHVIESVLSDSVSMDGISILANPANQIN